MRLLVTDERTRTGVVGHGAGVRGHGRAQVPGGHVPWTVEAGWVKRFPPAQRPSGAAPAVEELWQLSTVASLFPPWTLAVFGALAASPAMQRNGNDVKVKLGQRNYEGGSDGNEVHQTDWGRILDYNSIGPTFTKPYSTFTTAQHCVVVRKHRTPSAQLHTVLNIDKMK